MSGNNLNNNISNNESINLERSIQYSEHFANLDKAMNEYLKKLEENLDKNSDLCHYSFDLELDHLAELEAREADIIVRDSNTEIKHYIKTDGSLKHNYEQIYSDKYGLNKKIVQEENLEEVKSVDSKKENTDIKDNKDAKFRSQYLEQLPKAALCGALFSGVSVILKEYTKDDIE